MKFSERKGLKKPSELIQIDSMNDDLRVSIWNALDLLVWQKDSFLYRQHGEPDMVPFSRDLWFHYFKKRVDSRPDITWRILDEIRAYFFECSWYEVYDFLEFTLGFFKNERLNGAVNIILERELSGYRYVESSITQITNAEEVALLEEVLADKEFPAVKAHLRRSLELLSDRKQPDYRNSIKESISAVESIASVVSGLPKATLGDALKALEKKETIHPALKEGFSKLYGYTSDEGGIRHAMLEEPNIDITDAKFFLLSCTSFINYLKARMK